MTSTPRNDITGRSRQVCPLGEKKALKNKFFLFVKISESCGGTGIRGTKIPGMRSEVAISSFFFLLNLREGHFLILGVTWELIQTEILFWGRE